MSWFKKYKKKANYPDFTTTSPIPSSTLGTTMNTTTGPTGTQNPNVWTSGGWHGTGTIAGVGTNISGGGGVSAAGAYIGGGTTTYNAIGAATNTVTIPSSSFSIGNSFHFNQQHIIQFSNNSAEIVRLNTDGTVVWAAGIQIDEAAEAFSKTLTLGAELTAGITRQTKLNMRDSVFNDLIAIAKEKGSLTAEDLTYLLEASKIVEKLKGGKHDT